MSAYHFPGKARLSKKKMLVSVVLSLVSTINYPLHCKEILYLHTKRNLCIKLTKASLEGEFTIAMSKAMPKNVLGTALSCCCIEPKTGFYRDGFCKAGPRDTGRMVVNGRFPPAERHLCAEVTEEFLAFTFSRGNDLINPRPEFGFHGLRPGDRWCIW